MLRFEPSDNGVEAGPRSASCGDRRSGRGDGGRSDRGTLAHPGTPFSFQNQTFATLEHDAAPEAFERKLRKDQYCFLFCDFMQYLKMHLHTIADSSATDSR